MTDKNAGCSMPLMIGGIMGLCLLIGGILLSGGFFIYQSQTAEAGDALAVQVEQTVVARQTAEALAAQQTQAAAEQQAMVTALAAQLTQLAAPQEADQEVADAPDVVDPNDGIQPVADPNSDKPQVSIRQNANVRTGPGITCKAFNALLKDSVVPVLSKNRDGSWLEIGLPDGKTGWIATSVTNAAFITGNISSVVVAANPPVCPATPTPTLPPVGVAPLTATPTPTTAGPTQLQKTFWQVDFAWLGGGRRLQVQFTQNGGALSGSNRDNQAEVQIVTSGTVTGNTVVVTFTLSNGDDPRGSATCTGTIGGSGSSQTISGTFTATDGFGGTSGTCNFR